MNYYRAKFLRESKARPADWVIRPLERGGFELVYLGSWE